MTWITETLSDFHDDIKLSRIKRVKEERWGSVNLELHDKLISDDSDYIANELYSTLNSVYASFDVDVEVQISSDVKLTRKEIKKMRKIIKAAKNQGWFTVTIDC